VLVDDEPMICTLLQRLVSRHLPGVEIAVCHTGAKALAAVASRPVPLVIADYSLPGMGGFQLVTAVKTLSQATSTLLVTGLPLPAEAHPARAGGMHYFLAKPFALSEFEAVLDAAMAAWRAYSSPKLAPIVIPPEAALGWAHRLA
jgi:CheY-like chemotaxis protein